MEKQQMLDQAKERLAPFETGNIVEFIQHLTPKSATEHPLFIGIFLIFAFYAVIKRSKPVLIFLFTAMSSMLLVRYTLSPEMVGGGLTMDSMLPFVGGGLVIGIALIYYVFIKTD